MAKIFEWEWAFDEFSEDLTFVRRSMFGCRAAYLNGRLVMVLSEESGDSKWYGVLIPTEREHHQSLREQFPNLTPHSVLGKWLFLPAGGEDFEEDLRALARLVARRDLRLGVIPSPKKKRKAKRSKK